MKTQTTEKQRNLADQQYEIHRARQQKEVDANYEVFKKRLNALYKKYPGKCALMKNGEVLGIFDNIEDTLAEGNKRFEDHVFSAQEITKEVGSLPCIAHL